MINVISATEKKDFNNSFNIYSSSSKNSKTEFNKIRRIREFKEDIEKISRIDYSDKMVTIFGSARIDLEHKHRKYYEDAFEIAKKLGEIGISGCSGGGTGTMEAANLGFVSAGVPSLGIQPAFINDTLNERAVEMKGKTQITVNRMHSRKIMLAFKSNALIFMPGGLGTIDEFFEYMQLKEIGVIDEKIPFILYGEKFWAGLIDWMRENPVKRNLFAKNRIKELIIVDSPKQMREFFLGKNSEYKYDKSPQKIIRKFGEDIVKIYDKIDTIKRPSISIFGSSRVCRGHPYYQKAKFFARELKKSEYTIYFGGVDGVSEATRIGLNGEGKNSQVDAKNGILDVALNLNLTRKLVLGDTDNYIFHPGGLGTMDELSEYMVRIQLSDGIEKIPINLVNSKFWNGYIRWIEQYPVEWELADGYDLEVINFVSSFEDLKLI